MIAPEAMALAYLAPPHDLLWRWSADGATVTWSDGKTIAFAAEVSQVIAALAPSGLPPFGSLVLLLGACRDGWLDQAGYRGVLLEYARSLLLGPHGPQDLPAGMARLSREDMNRMFACAVQRVIAGLDAVACLAPELRQPTEAKIILAQTVFEPALKQLDPAEAAAVAQMLESGLNADQLQTSPSPRNRVLLSLTLELDLLGRGLEGLDPQRLALRRRTGLDALVKPADIDVDAAKRVRELLSSLRDDRDLAGLARLAQNVMAAVHIPRALSWPEELPVGGVSDLSNRGPFDRLLVSELAHDDLTLATRIALNEALYLRRESPAASPPPYRAILVDAGIRMWGVPRVFAAAVAMALAATADAKARVAVCRANGPVVDGIDLSTREGLIKHLESLQPHPHPGPTLKPFIDLLRAQGEKGVIEAMVVTHEDALADPAFMQALHGVPGQDWYVATVSRDGALRVHYVSAAGKRPICDATLDLADVMHPAPHAAPLLSEDDRSRWPAIFWEHPLPLLVPHNPTPQFTIGAGRHGLLAVTADGRLLQWRSPDRGPLEITSRLPPSARRGLFVDEARGLAHVVGVAKKERAVFITTADLNDIGCRTVRLEVDNPHRICRCPGQDVLLFMYRNAFKVIDPKNGKVAAEACVPRRSDAAWLSERFFANWGHYYAAVYDGSRASVEPVPPPPAPAFCLFDREALGPWLITSDGEVMSIDGTRAPVNGRLKYVYRLIGVSGGGRRVVVHAKGVQTGFVCLSLDDADPRWKEVSDPWMALAGPQFAWITAVYAPLITRLRGVILNPAGDLVLETPDQRYALRFNTMNQLVWQTVGRGDYPMPPISLAPAPVPRDSSFRLHMRRFGLKDGLEVFLDSRGLLHLKPMDRSLPQLTLTLNTAEAVAGWTSNGQTFGPQYFLRSQPTTDATAVYGLVRTMLSRMR